MAGSIGIHSDVVCVSTMSGSKNVVPQLGAEKMKKSMMRRNLSVAKLGNSENGKIRGKGEKGLEDINCVVEELPKPTPSRGQYKKHPNIKTDD